LDAHEEDTLNLVEQTITWIGDAYSQGKYTKLTDRRFLRESWAETLLKLRH
jgi:hypothetical protein